MLEKNVIEVAPLAFMRGRTLNDAFIIMDEAQNTTIEQMKMFLTRMGNNSKAVITGDITQIDLPNPRKSGLIDAINILDGVEGIHFCHFEDTDVVRHALVQRIVRAYETASRSSRNCRWPSGRPSSGDASRDDRHQAQARTRRNRSKSCNSRRIEDETGPCSSRPRHDDPSRPRFGPRPLAEDSCDETALASGSSPTSVRDCRPRARWPVFSRCSEAPSGYAAR